MTQTTDKKDPLFLCSVGKEGILLCERHAKVFELSLMTAKVPHTIYELDEEDTETITCQACDLTDTLEKPRFILPN